MALLRTLLSQSPGNYILPGYSEGKANEVDFIVLTAHYLAFGRIIRKNIEIYKIFVVNGKRFLRWTKTKQAELLADKEVAIIYEYEDFYQDLKVVEYNAQ